MQAWRAPAQSAAKFSATRQRVSLHIKIKEQDARWPHWSEPDWRQMAVLRARGAGACKGFQQRWNQRGQPLLMVRRRIDFAGRR